MQNPLQHAFLRIRKDIPEYTRLVVVTKGRTLSQIHAVVDSGSRDLGENRVNEAAEKVPEFSSIQDLRWHMIGNLQRNKVKVACEIFDMIQSVDRLKLANAIEKHCNSFEKRMPVLVEVNIGGEQQKHGSLPADALQLCRQISQLPHLELKGLMAMAPWLPAEETRPLFARMHALFLEIKSQLHTRAFDTLSMGMTSDYRIAVEEGSTMVRVGRAIFE